MYPPVQIASASAGSFSGTVYREDLETYILQISPACDISDTTIEFQFHGGVYIGPQLSDIQFCTRNWIKTPSAIRIWLTGTAESQLSNPMSNEPRSEAIYQVLHEGLRHLIVEINNVETGRFDKLD